MSNYHSYAINPKTRRVELAESLDNYYGRHRYGVRFRDGRVYPIDDVEEVIVDLPLPIITEGFEFYGKPTTTPSLHRDL